MALTHIVPSGWEIVNMRLNSTGSSHFIDNPDYKGKFLLPPVSCEAMYNNRIRSKTTGKWVEVN